VSPLPKLSFASSHDPKGVILDFEHVPIRGVAEKPPNWKFCNTCTSTRAKSATPDKNF
jgi:hypothetical protein